jgi:hypothetical protein
MSGFQVSAQQASTGTKKPALEDDKVEAGADAGGYSIISSLEFGYRGKSIDGDINKYRSDLNYTAGPRMFDSTFLMKSNSGQGSLFETLLVTTTGWGGDPNGQLRVNAEKAKWYRFDGSYRRFKYFVFLTTLQIRTGCFRLLTLVFHPTRLLVNTVTTLARSWEILI